MVIKETSRPRVLVVAGDSVALQRRCKDLSLAACKTFQCDDVLEALAQIRNREVDILLIVTPMESLTGVDLAATLREIDQGRYHPVIIQVPSADDQLTCGLFKQGADAVITAGTSAQELAVRIESLMRVKELHDQLNASREALQKSLDRERKLLAKLKRDNANLQALCVTDPLTHVQNVRSFRDILEHEFKMCRRYNQPLSLLMIDVDHFKLVNDMHGHPSGDYVLKELAVILKRSVRDSDVVARTGGEEFSVILPKADSRRSAVLATRIRREVASRHFSVYGKTIRITISIGTASIPADAELCEPQMMLYFADQALLQAKESGRDRVVAVHDFDPAARSRLRRQYNQAQSPPPFHENGNTAGEASALDHPVDVISQG